VYGTCCEVSVYCIPVCIPLRLIIDVLWPTVAVTVTQIFQSGVFWFRRIRPFCMDGCAGVDICILPEIVDPLRSRVFSANCMSIIFITILGMKMTDGTNKTNNLADIY